jgi:hypothetical protein
MDSERLEKLLGDAARGAFSKSVPTNTVKMDSEATAVLKDYADDVTLRILESAAILAQGRNSSEITEQDIALILGEFIVRPCSFPGIGSYSVHCT